MHTHGPWTVSLDPPDLKAIQSTPLLKTLQTCCKAAVIGPRGEGEGGGGSWFNAHQRLDPAEQAMPGLWQSPASRSSPQLACPPRTPRGNAWRGQGCLGPRLICPGGHVLQKCCRRAQHAAPCWCGAGHLSLMAKEGWMGHLHRKLDTDEC